MKKTAVISDCKTYRYQLSRVWDDSKPLVLYIMLNPSIADAEQDDPTIRRCIGFARAYGFGGFFVGNLFAYRATNPEELYQQNIHGFDIVGPGNDKHIAEMAEKCTHIVMAYGNDGGLQGRNAVIAEAYPNVYCFGLTKDGHPKHPLFLPANSQLRKIERNV